MHQWLNSSTGAAGHALLPHFDRPAWLLLILPLCVLAWWGAGGRRKRDTWSSGTRRTVYLLIRSTVIALICTALAEPHLRWRADDVAVVAVVDTSDSVPSAQKKLASDFLTASLAKRPPSDRFGLVTVARNSIVQSLPTSHPSGIDAPDTGPGGGDASNIQRGIDLARSLIPTDAGGRILLISDGNETAGSLAIAAANLSGTGGIPIDVASVEYDRSAMVRIDDVDVPAWARDGDTVTAHIVVTAGEPTATRLTVMLDGQPVDLDPDSPGFSARVDLKPGKQVLVQQLRLPAGPSHRIEALLEPDHPEASIPQLLRAEGVTFTSSRGRILVLAEDPQAAAPFVQAVSSSNIQVEVRPASSAPYSLAEWAAFDGVVLFDQPAFNFTQQQQQDLVRYVHDTGGGLLVIGGPNSYGAGGWIGSPLADALPIVLDPPQKRQMPMGALAIIIDHSGSMGAPVAGTGMTQQQIANNAAILGVRALSRLDNVAVIQFDSNSNVVVPLTPVSDPDAIARQINTIGPAGGTNLFPAIDLAAAELDKSPAGVKHIIILTDGETTGEREEGFAKAAALRARKVTISTVAIGDQANSNLLVRLAQLGGGRNYIVESENSRAVLPQIFIKEAQVVRRTLIWEGPAFAPSVATFSDSLRGINTPFPGITGYVVTADRGGLSTVSLRGPEGDPILAQWQHGLGRVTAFTSDASPRWNAAWKGWGSHQSFWEQQLKWALRATGDANARVTVDTRGERAKVALELTDAAGERINFANIHARVAPPGGGGADTQARDAQFQQTGPGRYEAEVDAAAVGTHLLSIRYDAGTSGQPDERAGTVRAAIIRRSGEEFRRTTPDTNLLWMIARTTGGRIYHLDGSGADLWVRERLAMPERSRPVWLEVAILAIALFLVDAAARRVFIDPARVKSGLTGLLSRAPEAPLVAMSALTAAKARARAAPAEYAIKTSVDRETTPDLVNTQPATELPLTRAANPTEQPSTPVQITRTETPTETPGDAMTRLRAAKSRSLPNSQERKADS